MSEFPSAKFHTVNIVIDPEDAQFLSARRRKKFLATIAERANSLRKIGIPTIWIHMGEDYHFNCYTKNVANIVPGVIQFLPDGIIKDEMKRTSSPEKNDLIFMKGDANAFDHPLLASILKEMGVTTLLVSGMNTTSCVTKTLRGALANHYKCVVLTDCLADHLSPERKNDGCANRHASILRTRLGKDADNVRFVLSKDALADYKKLARLSATLRQERQPLTAKKPSVHHVPMKTTKRPEVKKPNPGLSL